MGQPAAKQGDTVVAADGHVVVLPPPASPVALPPPFNAFNGPVNGDLSGNVNIMKRPAATMGSTAQNVPPHIVPPPLTSAGGTFKAPPANKATVSAGSSTVNINGKPAARNGDAAETCNEPDAVGLGAVVVPGKVVAAGTVLIG